MTVDEILKTLGKFPPYVDGEWFRPNALGDFCSCSLSEGRQMCRDAFKAGKLKRKTRKIGGRAGTSKVYYSKAITCPEAYGPWRKLTNAEIGIVEPFQFGCPV